LSLAKKAGQAGALMLFRKGWGAIVNIGVMAFLARTLNKSDFGLVAISGTLIGMIQTIGVAGISEYIVFYNGEDAREKQNGAFWLNALLTLLVAIAILITVPFWADFYKDERIVKLVYLLLIGFVFTMFSSIPLAIFRKKLEFKTMIKTQTIFGTLSQVSQIVFVYLGFGVYSLAMPNALIIPIMTIVLFKQSGYKINFTDFGTKQWKEITKYTKHVVGSRILTKLVNEGDTLLVGKLLGMEALGVYDLAFKFANLVNSQLLPIITNISLPIFSKDRNDILLTRDRFIKSTQIIAFLIFPISGLIILFAADIIKLLYGVKWDLAIVPMQIFCVHAAFRSISSSSSGLFNAFNKPHYGFYFNLFFTPIFIIGVLISAQYGLLIVCLVVTSIRVLGGMVNIKIALNLINVTLLKFINSIGSSVIFSIVITILLSIIYKNHTYINMVLILFVFIISYITLNIIFDNSSFKNIKIFINKNSFIKIPFLKSE
jgi:O-antigen/teichoic acid export membrane protein